MWHGTRIEIEIKTVFDLSQNGKDIEGRIFTDIPRWLFVISDCSRYFLGEAIVFSR